MLGWQAAADVPPGMARDLPTGPAIRPGHLDNRPGAGHPGNYCPGAGGRRVLTTGERTRAGPPRTVVDMKAEKGGDNSGGRNTAAAVVVRSPAGRSWGGSLRTKGERVHGSEARRERALAATAAASGNYRLTRRTQESAASIRSMGKETGWGVGTLDGLRYSRPCNHLRDLP